MSPRTFIGNRDPNVVAARLSRAERARMAVEVALAERDIAPDVRFEKPSKGSGVVAVVIDGKKVLMHLGRDEADAMFGLAALASRPAGRAGAY
jgi:hypothetical protein